MSNSAWTFVAWPFCLFGRIGHMANKYPSPLLANANTQCLSTLTVVQTSHPWLKHPLSNYSDATSAGKTHFWVASVVAEQCCACPRMRGLVKGWIRICPRLGGDVDTSDGRLAAR